MSRRNRTLNQRRAMSGRHSARSGRGRTRALATALTLAAAGIAATAWLTSAQESTRVTTTATANSNANTTASAGIAAPGTSQPAPGQPATTQPATASPQTPPVTAMAPVQQPSAPSTAGQRAFIDPVTGQLRQPEHDELAAIAAAAAAAAPTRRAARTAGAANAAPESFGPGGSIEAVVPEDLHTFTVATRGPDGRITIEHAQGAKEAAKVMRANSAKKGPQAPVSREKAKEDRNDR
jgi:ribonuclease E